LGELFLTFRLGHPQVVQASIDDIVLQQCHLGELIQMFRLQG
jgi:hypothetical protein